MSRWTRVTTGVCYQCRTLSAPNSTTIILIHMIILFSLPSCLWVNIQWKDLKEKQLCCGFGVMKWETAVSVTAYVYSHTITVETMRTAALLSVHGIHSAHILSCYVTLLCVSNKNMWFWYKLWLENKIYCTLTRVSENYCPFFVRGVHRVSVIITSR